LDLKKLDLPFELRPYQVEGVDFLLKTPHALLADDMGLGKTIQAIVALKSRYDSEGIFRCLLIVPNSLVTNWRREFEIWFPSAPLTVIEGDAINRHILLERTTGFMLATYDQIRIAFGTNMNETEKSKAKIKKFDLVILDEAQKIKNSNSQTTLSSHLIQKDAAWLLTGTPLENNESEIVAVFSFLKRKIIQKGMDIWEIRNLIAPHMLRRLKKDILDELPDLIEQNFYLELTKEQVKEYQSIYKDRDLKNPLEVVTELKKICNFSSDGSSAKLARLKDIVEELYNKDEKLLVFSQYVKSLEKIKDSFETENIYFYHGGLKKIEKDRVLNSFKNHNGHAVLLISLGAGAVGLNLQEASTVVLFDRWWNPAIENQAIARAHRMGRTEPVHAIKFITSGTIEDKIDEILKDKADLFDDVVEGAVELREKLKLKEILEI
jgi:SNF2 family DNA or RNA helicase